MHVILSPNDKRGNILPPFSELKYDGLSVSHDRDAHRGTQGSVISVNFAEMEEQRVFGFEEELNSIVIIHKCIPIIDFRDAEFDGRFGDADSLGDDVEGDRRGGAFYGFGGSGGLCCFGVRFGDGDGDTDRDRDEDCNGDGSWRGHFRGAEFGGDREGERVGLAVPGSLKILLLRGQGPP
jgi:hypothetical protein